LKVEDHLSKKSCEKILTNFEPVTIVPSKLVPINIKNPNKIITKFYPKSILKVKVKPTPFIEQKYLVLLLFLLFLFFLIFNWLMKNKILDLQ